MPITGTPSQYATATDLANVGALPTFVQSLTSAQQTEALQNASAFMDSYFASRFMMPIVTWTYDVTLCCVQIAIYYLVQARGYNPNNPAEDTYRIRYEQCVNWLKDVARGQATPQMTDSQFRCCAWDSSPQRESEHGVSDHWHAVPGTDMGHVGEAMTAAQFAARLEKLADSTEELCQELADETLHLIDHGFAAEEDPHGYAWAPRADAGLRKRRGGVISGASTRPLLYETGYLREHFVIAGVNRAGFGIVNDAPYGGFLNDGTRKMPARPMVPVKEAGLGNWAEPLQKVAREFIAEKLGK